MAIPFIDDLIAWLYRLLGRIGSVLVFAGLLLGTVMAGIWFSTGELPHWSAFDLGMRSPHTSIAAIDKLLTHGWTGRLGIPCSLIAIGVSLHLTFGRWARQMVQAEIDLYASPMSQADHASALSGNNIRFRKSTSF